MLKNINVGKQRAFGYLHPISARPNRNPAPAHTAPGARLRSEKAEN